MCFSLCVTVTKVISDMFLVAVGILLNVFLVVCIYYLIQSIVNEANEEDEIVIDWDSVRVMPVTPVTPAETTERDASAAMAIRAGRRAILRSILEDSSRKLYALKASKALELVMEHAIIKNAEKGKLIANIR